MLVRHTDVAVAPGLLRIPFEKLFRAWLKERQIMTRHSRCLAVVIALGFSTSGETSEFFGLLHDGIVPAGTPEVFVGGHRPDGRVLGGISADGHVLSGTYTLPIAEQPPCPPNADCPLATEAFRWSPESRFEPIRPAGFPPGRFREGGPIAADGLSLLVYGRLPPPDTIVSSRSFLWSVEQGLTDFGTVVEEEMTHVAIATDLSADGSVVVGSFDDEAIRWTSEKGIELLGDLPGGAFRSVANGVSHNGSVIAGTGTSVSDAGSQAFRWTEETGLVGLGYVDSLAQTTATGISPSGEVVIGYADGSSEPEVAFRWTQEDGIQDIGPGIPTAIAEDGTIVGHSYGEGTTFVWSEAHGRRGLEDVLANDFGLGESIEGWTLESIWDISADGTTLVGAGMNPAAEWDVWVARRLPGDYNSDALRGFSRTTGS